MSLEQERVIARLIDELHELGIPWQKKSDLGRSTLNRTLDMYHIAQTAEDRAVVRHLLEAEVRWLDAQAIAQERKIADLDRQQEAAKWRYAQQGVL